MQLVIDPISMIVELFNICLIIPKLICILFVLLFAMSNLRNHRFNALDITSKNYLTWILDVEIHLVLWVWVTP